MKSEELLKHKGKSIDEVIILLQEEENRVKRNEERKVKAQSEFIESLVEQTYFKLTHNPQSSSYVKILNKNLKAESVDIFVADEEIKYHVGSRQLNVLWFNCEGLFFHSKGLNIAKQISKEEYEKVFKVRNSLKNLL